MEILKKIGAYIIAFSIMAIIASLGLGFNF